MFDAEIGAIREAQARLEKETVFIDSSVKDVGKRFEAFVLQKWKATFPSLTVEMCCSLQGGSHTTSWSLSGFISTVNHLTPFVDGDWRRLKFDPDSISPAPASMDAINAFCAGIEKETGIEFKIYLRKKKDYLRDQHDAE